MHLVLLVVVAVAVAVAVVVVVVVAVAVATVVVVVVVVVCCCCCCCSGGVRERCLSASVCLSLSPLNCLWLIFEQARFMCDGVETTTNLLSRKVPHRLDCA